MTAADVEAHQLKHGFLTDTMRSVEAPGTAQKAKRVKPRQNATEREYGLILEAMKQRGDIVDYKPFGMRLEWGADPETGKPMVYSPDFTVWEYPNQIWEPYFVEVKGGYIFPKDLIRFKGCRAEWPMFRFELHQKREGCWARLL
jgi:hypothetical protein